LSAVEPILRIPVGVVVERRAATSPWADFLWRSVAVLDGVPDAQPWTPLETADDVVTLYAGSADIALYRSEADNYRINLVSGAPGLWIALDPTGGDPPYRIAMVTADPAEGEGLTEPGQSIVDVVAMTDAVRDAVAAFVAEHYVERPFEKRKRDRANPEALARREREQDRR
jgi:hypothetical protein